MDFANVSIGLAFLAGMASFLSPCVFALVPAYVGYLGGRTAASSTGEEEDRWIALSHGLAFVLGFSVIFILLGLATSALGGTLHYFRLFLSRVGGVIVIIFGIHLTGIIRIPFLEYDLRPHSLLERNRGYLASFLMGVFFSAGWSPCVGPILGAILTLALFGGSISQGILLLSAYSIGLAIPFLIASTQIGLVTAAIRRYGKAMRVVEISTGVILILLGILLFSGRFEQLASFGTFFGYFDELIVGRYILIIVIALILLGLIPAAIATKKGRKFIDWWLFGTGLFPIAFPLSIIMKNESQEIEAP